MRLRRTLCPPRRAFHRALFVFVGAVLPSLSKVTAACSGLSRCSPAKRATMSLPTPAAYLPAATASPGLVMTPASTDGSHAKESYFIYGPPSPPPQQHQQIPEHGRASPQSPAKRAKWAAAVSSAADWNAVQSVWWAALPLLLYLVALILALVVLFGTAEYYSFMSVTQNSGTGRLDYYVLSESEESDSL